MDELSYNLTRKHISGDITATENSFNAAQAHAALQSFALSFQDSMKEAMSMPAEMGGVYDEVNEGGSVFLNKEYGQNLSSTDFPMIVQMRVNGDVTKQTQLAEAKRRGIFSEDFDVDAEVAATKGEVPVQGITSVGLREPPGGANTTL